MKVARLLEEVSILISQIDCLLSVFFKMDLNFGFISQPN
jgi:hypothetical protein